MTQPNGKAVGTGCVGWKRVQNRRQNKTCGQFCTLRFLGPVSQNSFARANKVTSPTKKSHRLLLTLSFASVAPLCCAQPDIICSLISKELLYSIVPLFFLWPSSSPWAGELMGHRTEHIRTCNDLTSTGTKYGLLRLLCYPCSLSECVA